jgi:hypothetical protein
VSLSCANANPDLPALDYIHRVAFVTRAEQTCAGFTIEALQQVTQFSCSLVIERFKQWHVAQCVDGHSRKSNGTPARVAAIHVGEKLQLSSAVVPTVSADRSQVLTYAPRVISPSPKAAQQRRTPQRKACNAGAMTPRFGVRQCSAAFVARWKKKIRVVLSGSI